MAQIFRGNVVTPLQTLGHTIGIGRIDPRAHTTVFGNDDAVPSDMLKALIRQDLAAGRKVVSIAFNGGYAALPSGTATIIDLTRGNITFRMDPSKAGILAALIAASPDSFAIDLGGLEPGPAARVVERIAAAISTQPLVKPTTFAIDLVDALTPKRRMGLDADAVQQINSLLGRGYDLGVRLLMAANAPSEMPLEFDRGTVQSIVTRVTRAGIRSVAAHVGDDGRLVDNAMLQGVGLASIPQGDFWFFPMTDDPFGPYLVETPEDEADDGDGSERRASAKAATEAFGDSYHDAVIEAEKAAEEKEVERKVQAALMNQRVRDEVRARSARPAQAVRKPVIRVAGGTLAKAPAAARPTIRQVEDMLRIAGVIRPTCRARAVVTAAQMRDATLSLVDAVVAAKSDAALRAACFGETLYTAGMVSKGVGAALAYRFMTEHGGDVEAFRTRLLRSDEADVVGAAGAWLRRINARRTTLDAGSRVEAISKAWRNHAGGRIARTADNDDVALPDAA